MRGLLFGGFLAAVGAAAFYFLPVGSLNTGPTYPVSVNDGVKMLSSARPPVGQPPFNSMEIVVSKPATNVVEYEMTEGFSGMKCRVELTSAGEARSYAKPSCQSGAAISGGMAETADELTQVYFAEFVASTLEKRSFDDKLVKMQSAGTVMKNLPKMQKDALRMKREFDQMEADLEAADYADDGWGEETPRDW